MTEIDKTMERMRKAWADTPDVEFRVVVEAWAPVVGRLDARYVPIEKPDEE